MSTFTPDIIARVWEQASTVQGYDPNVWRQDFAGAWICRDQYGMRTRFGWQIDHLRPISKGGSDIQSNLCPMHWRNNLKKSDDYPNFLSEITSKGNQNIEFVKTWQIKE